MSDITYKNFYGQHRLKHQLVYLDGKHVGKIQVSKLNGKLHYQYLPKLNSRKYGEGGEVFTSPRDCQKSLEIE
tara:strand:+ start:133 stop:351 length:219 start_codon:yes stop_codon:yes gene_type:complete